MTSLDRHPLHSHFPPVPESQSGAHPRVGARHKRTSAVEGMSLLSPLARPSFICSSNLWKTKQESWDCCLVRETLAWLLNIRLENDEQDARHGDAKRLVYIVHNNFK